MAYDVFMIDPPWKETMGGKRDARPTLATDLPYRTMQIDDIFNLLDAEIFSKAAKQHVVFLWTTEQYLFQTECQMRRRKYDLHCRFIWDKGNGFPAGFTVRYSHEYLLWYYVGGLLPIAESLRGRIKTVISEPAREHSRKPELAYEIINGFYPNLRKYDVFTREHRHGWDQFGDQKGMFNGKI